MWDVCTCNLPHSPSPSLALPRPHAGVRNSGDPWDNIVLFSGQSTKRIFDPPPPPPAPPAAAAAARGGTGSGILHKDTKLADMAAIAPSSRAPPPPPAEYPVPAFSLLDTYLSHALHRHRPHGGRRGHENRSQHQSQGVLRNMETGAGTGIGTGAGMEGGVSTSTSTGGGAVDGPAYYHIAPRFNKYVR